MSAQINNESLALALNNTLLAVVTVGNEATLFAGVNGSWSNAEVIDNISPHPANFYIGYIHGRRGEVLGNVRECLIIEGFNLTEWQNVGDQGWFRINKMSSTATGCASMIGSDFGGNSEALVQEGSDIVHYWKNGPATSPWNRGVTVSSRASAPPFLMESSFRANTDAPRNFEALILEDRNLVHYWRDNSAPGLPWHRGVVVSSIATGPASMFQGGFGVGPNGWDGNFEALVLEGRNVVHYWRDNFAPGFPWHRGEVVSSAAIGRASLVQSGNRASTDFHGNFEAIIAEDSGVYHYWRDNSANGFPWHKGALIAK